MDEKSGVYFILAESGEVKIGYSARPGARLRGLQTSAFSHLRMVRVVEGDKELERHFHTLFEEYRIRGEWFRNEGRLSEFLKEVTNETVNLEMLDTDARIAEQVKPRNVPFKPAQFGGCVICNRFRKRAADLCDNCIDTLAAWFRDPMYPENNPEALWQGLHGQKDTWDQTLGPTEWPYSKQLVDFIEWTILSTMPEKRPERGALVVRSMPAQIRLAGSFVLRKLTDEGKLVVYTSDSTGGFYFRAAK